MKKTLKLILSFVLIALFVCAFSACSSLTGSTPKDEDSVDMNVDEQIYEAYKLYQAEGGTLSYEDWLATIKGEKGDQGNDGNGIASIQKTTVSGLVDTYEITFTDGSKTNFYITNGNGIVHIDKTSTDDYVDTYTIYYSNGSTETFTVTNGEKGSDGAPGRGITRVCIDEEGNLVVVYTDDTESEVGKFTADCDCVAHPHEIVEKTIVEREPTCTQTGITYIICETCREAIKTIITEEKPHNYTDVVTEPTCTEQGYTTHTCTDCGNVVVDSYVPAGHTEVIDEAVAPTCTETGLTEGKHCSVCGEVLVAQEEVPALGHNYVEGICTHCGESEIVETEGLVFTLKQDDTYEVSGYTGESTIVNILSQHNEKAVTSIGAYAFEDCSSLTNITIPDSVTSIGDYAFSGCSNLTSIAIPDSMTSIGAYAFEDYSGLTRVYYTGDIASWCGISFNWAWANPVANAHNLYINNELLTLAVIPDGTTTIKQYTFDRGSCITNVVLPLSVTTIEHTAFERCSNIQSVYYKGTIESRDNISVSYENEYLTGATWYYYTEEHPVQSGNYWHYEDGEIVIGAPGEHTYSNDHTCETRVCTICGYVCAPTTEHNIGDDCTCTICGRKIHMYEEGCCIVCGNKASEGLYYEYNSSTDTYTVAGIGTCTDTEIFIPSSYNDKDVVAIKDYAFAENKNINNVFISDTLITIGRYAFQGCSDLTSVTLGAGITEIGYYAFYGCSGLTSVYYTGDIESWCGILHNSYTNPLESAHNLYINGELVTELTIPDTVTQFAGSCVFVGWNGTSIVLPNTLTAIEGWTFQYCDKLMDITIPNSITSIGRCAFRGCSSLTSITFQGTKAQWDAISKGSGWNSNTGSYTIHCTDGDIEKE